MVSRNYPFLGGYDLRRICVSWFVSYSYYEHIDSNHKNWALLKTAKDGISKYEASRQYHELWLSKVKDMKDSLLNKNTLRLDAKQVKEMAFEILQNLSIK